MSERLKLVLAIVACLVAYFLFGYGCMHQTPEELRQYEEYQKRNAEEERTALLRAKLQRIELEKQLQKAEGH